MAARSRWFSLLGLIILLAFVLRFYKLTSIPSGFYFDEVTVAINGATIADKFTDEFGNFAPDYFRIGADYRNPVLFYLTAPFIGAFGLNVFAVRGATALFGVFMVLLTYFLTLNLFKKQSIAITSTLLVAISPWLINLSRSANEVIFALFFLTAADALFIYSLISKKHRYLIGVYFLAVLCWFSYAGATLISSLHLVGFVFFAYLAKSPKKIKLAALTTLIAFIIFPNIFYALAGPEKLTGRFSQVSIFSSAQTKLVLEEQIREDGTHSHQVLATRFLHNKITNLAIDMVSNYTTYFSPQFLLGSSQLPARYVVDRTFLVYIFEPLLLLAGLFFMVKKFSWQKGFVIFMLITGPVPAALTLEDTPNMQRAIFMIPALQIIIGFGIYSLLVNFKKLKRGPMLFKFVILVLVVLYSYFLIYFMHQLFIHQPSHRNWYRDSHWQGAAELFQQLEGKYSKVYITSPISYYYLAFYSPEFKNHILNHPDFKSKRDYQNSWELGKYYFSSKTCILSGASEAKTNTLYITGKDCPIPAWARVLGEARTSDNVVFLTFLDVPLNQDQIKQLQ